MLSVKILFAACAISVAAWAADPFVGTWKLNPEKTKSTRQNPGVNRTPMLIVKATSDGYEMSSAVNVAGNQWHLDGQDRKIEPSASSFGGAVGADHTSSRRINSNTIQTTSKREGKVVGTIRYEVSPDTRTMTGTFDGTAPDGEKFHTVAVYEKQ
jgi:hypothetical protein